MSRFTQIAVCGSTGALYALDADGDVWEFHFTQRTWSCISRRRDGGDEGGA